MGQGTAMHIRQTVSSALLLILGEEADMNAGMGQRGIAYGNECLSVMLVSANNA